MIITRDREKVFYDFTPDIGPRVSVSSGDRLTVETLDAAGGMFLDGWVYVRPNPATGPIYVDGALPGDTLEVQIHGIKLVGRGYIHIPNHKESTKFTRSGHEFVKVDAMPDGSLHVLNNDKILPAYPMLGVIGVADAGGGSGSDAGDYGGNMDNSLIKPGAKVYLPVSVKGALLGVGDAHGAMGDGEVFDQGVEMCADVDLTVTVRKDMKINRPLVISDALIATAATADTMEKASELAISDMRDILETYCNLPHTDAGLAIGLYGNLRVCQLVNHTMRMEISRDVLKNFY